jgi:hypothetical protein
MKLPWKAQLEHHGTPGEDVPLSVTLREAEDVPHLAITLTHWLVDGGVTVAAQSD